MKFITQGCRHRGGTPSLSFFLQKVHFALFCYFFPRRCTIISDLDFDFERVLKFQRLLYFHPRTQVLCKSSETIDDMKLDSSSDTASSSENTYSFPKESSDNVTFYRWQIVEKKITKSKVDVTFEDAAEMFKDDIKTLKEHIYIKRRQSNPYLEIKAFLSENDLMLHVHFAKSYKNDQQDAIQSTYFRNQCFMIFTAYCYAKIPNDDVRNDNVIVVTERSEQDRVASMSCLQRFIYTIEHMHEKTYENFYVWSDRMGSQFRSRYIFKLLAIKGPMDGIGGTVKNVILRKVKSGQLMVIFST